MYNMTKDTNEQIDAITIKVETTRTDDYHRINQICNDGYQYIVKQEDAGKALLLIAQLYIDYNLPCIKVYPTNWKSVSKDTTKTLKQIADEIKLLAIRRGTINIEDISDTMTTSNGRTK